MDTSLLDMRDIAPHTVKFTIRDFTTESIRHLARALLALGRQVNNAIDEVGELSRHINDERHPGDYADSRHDHTPSLRRLRRTEPWTRFGGMCELRRIGRWKPFRCIDG